MTQTDHESLGPEHLELLSRAREASGMPPAAKARVLARLGAPLPPGTGGGPPSGGGGLEPSVSVATPGTVPAWVSVTLLGLAVVSFGAVAAAPVVGVPDPEDIVVERPTKKMPPLPERASAPPTPEEPVAPEPAPAAVIDGVADTDGPPEAASTAGTTLGTAAAAPEKASPASIKEETALLTAARRALGKKDPDGALTTLRTHARRFPKGALLEEREALTAVALCEDGQTAAGTRAAKGFLASHGKSGLAPRVRTACGLEEK